MINLKNILRALNLFLVLAALFLGYKIYEQRVAAAASERLNQAILKEKSEMVKNQDSAIQAGVIDNTYVAVAYPIDQAKHPIPVIESALKDYITKTFGESKQVSEVKSLAFLDAKATDTEVNKVKRYDLHVRTYQNGESKVSKSDDKLIKSLLVDDQGALFEVTNLVTDEAFLKEKLHAQLETTLKESNQLNETSQQGLEAFKGVDLKTLKVDVGDGKVTVRLAEKIGEQDAVILPLSSLFEKINESFLKGPDLDAYRVFKEEKAREEDNRRAKAIATGRPQVVLQGKVVALTFDDGPHATNTERILDTLKKYHAKATFFTIGSSIPGREKILQRAVAEGSEIGNHTWSHPSLPSLSASNIKWQIEETNKAIKAATGQTAKTVRPPYGATNANVQAAIGYPQILWDVDTLDWKNRNPQMILDNVKSRVCPGAVILMHDIHGTTADALPQVMDYLVSQGYSFVTVSELYGL